MIKLFTLNKRGDTIVEVLIAIAVINIVLGGAYASANRSSGAIRNAQERGQALQLAEANVELIKAHQPTDASFCYDQGGTKYAPIPVLPGPTPCTIASSAAGFMISDAQPSTHTYTVKITWDAIGGNKANLELDYVAQ